MEGAAHNDGNKTKETGTAVTTIKDCSAPIPPDPSDTNIAAITPIMTHQNALKGVGGEFDPTTTIEIVYAIESVVVITKSVVSTRNKHDTKNPWAIVG